jgi:MFS family permease
MAEQEPVSARSNKPTQLVITVASAVGLSIMGDSLMYGILPLEAETLGFTLSQVGLLLSANRLIRLASNTWAGAVFERLGPRLPFLGSTILGFLAALMYGVGWGFVVFLLARVGWGIAWSGLRQGGYEAVWSGDERHKGRLMGVLFGMIRLGSAISVVIGGYLRDQYGYQVSVSVIASLTALAIPVALFARWPGQVSRPATQSTFVSLEGWRHAFRRTIQRWLLAAGFLHALLEGVVVATASVFLAGRLSEGNVMLAGIGVGTVAGALLAVRWTANLLFGPLIGALSDWLGQTPTLVLLVCLVLVGVVGASSLSGVWLPLSLLVVFVSLAGLFVTLTAASSGVATQASRPHLFVGVYTTIVDGGAAVGPLLAFNLGQFTGFEALYISIAAVLLVVVLQFWRVSTNEFLQPKL